MPGICSIRFLISPVLSRLNSLWFLAAILLLWTQLPTAAYARESRDTAQQNLSMIMSWNQNHSAVVNIPLLFNLEVERLSNQSLQIHTYGPEVVSPFEQLRPVSNGAFDLLFSHGLYHTGTTWIGAALDTVNPDVEWRRSSGFWDMVDQYYTSEHNLKLIAIPAATTGFRIFLHEDVPTDGDLSGTTIRSLHTQRRLLRGLSATPILLPPSEIYSAVEKSVIDGLTWSSVGAYGFRFHEVAPQIVEPGFGNVSYLILMNLDAFSNLKTEHQELLLEAGKSLELDTIDRFKTLFEQERELMLQEGARLVTLKSFNREQADRSFAEEVWETAIRYTGEKALEFRDFVRAHTQGQP